MLKFHSHFWSSELTESMNVNIEVRSALKKWQEKVLPKIIVGNQFFKSNRHFQGLRNKEYTLEGSSDDIFV